MSAEISLHHDFPGFTLDVQFQMEKGVTALFGPSGAGKTSTINAIAGLLKTNRGKIVIDGHTVLDTKAGVNVPAHARRIGYVFQDARLFPHMSVENNLRFGWRRAEVRASDGEFAHVVELLGLEHLLARKPARLSGGEKNRVALGRALLSAPGLLLLDEPLAALDAPRKAEILPYLERLRDEARMPMLYVSHSLDDVTRLADSVVVLREGRVAASGPVFDLMSDLQFASASGVDSYGAVLDATVKSHRDGLSILAFDGGELIVSQIAKAPGARLRVRIRAEDIMLALEEPRAISANNVIPAAISAIRESAGHADVQLAAGRAKLIARITSASLKRLALAPGLKIFAIVKSVTVDRNEL